jgi:hypothetical protein
MIVSRWIEIWDELFADGNDFKETHTVLDYVMAAQVVSVASTPTMMWSFFVGNNMADVYGAV